MKRYIVISKADGLVTIPVKSIFPTADILREELIRLIQTALSDRATAHSDSVTESYAQRMKANNWKITPVKNMQDAYLHFHNMSLDNSRADCSKRVIDIDMRIKYTVDPVLGRPLGVLCKQDRIRYSNILKFDPDTLEVKTLDDWFEDELK